MADIQIQQRNSKRKASPKLDLTPMVDLGFILITFFIYTTQLTENKMLDLKLPDDTPTKEITAFPDTSTLTLIPTSKHRVAYYNGAFQQKELSIIGFHELRTIIQQKQSTLKLLPKNFSKEAHSIHVLIKPDKNSTYDDVIRTLDEMTINDISYFAMVDISSEETKILTKQLQ